MKHFNAGFAAAIPAASPYNPVPFAIIEGLSFDSDPEYLTWSGNWIHPKVVALKGAKTTGKIDTIDIMAGALAQMYGVTPGAGSMLPVVAETKIGLTGASYTVNNVGTGTQNYFVQNLTDGIWMSRVTSVTTTGQYSVNEATGVYTFNAGDNGKNFAFTYAYGSASVGKTTTIANQLGGIVTGVQLVGFSQTTSGKPLGVKIRNAYFDKWSLNMAAGDLVKKNLTWFAAEDPTTLNVFDLWTGE